MNRTEEDFFDTCQFPVNAIDASVEHSFIHQVIPRLLDRKIGVLAMKTLADGRFFSKKVQNDRVVWDTNNPVIPDTLTIEEALSFSWSLPISVLITGAENPQMLREKIAIARRFQKMTKSQREALIDKVSELPNRDKVEYYKDVKA